MLREARNPNLEIRNKFEKEKREDGLGPLPHFPIAEFGFPSDFEIRIFPRGCHELLVAALPP
jgi:hypothetical protein